MEEIKRTSTATNGHSHLPEQGSVAEVLQFKKLQDRFVMQFEHIFPDNRAPRTVIIIPSLTMDEEILSKISGINHYEERMLCMLMLLRMPRTHVIYVTSETIDPVIVDYYLHMLPGVTGYHALRRLTLLSCHDSSSTPLTKKILERPRLIQRIKDFIPPDHEAHMKRHGFTLIEALVMLAATAILAALLLPVLAQNGNTAQAPEKTEHSSFQHVPPDP